MTLIDSFEQIFTTLSSKNPLLLSLFAIKCKYDANIGCLEARVADGMLFATQLESLDYTPHLDDLIQMYQLSHFLNLKEEQEVYNYIAADEFFSPYYGREITVGRNFQKELLTSNLALSALEQQLCLRPLEEEQLSNARTQKQTAPLYWKIQLFEYLTEEATRVREEEGTIQYHFSCERYAEQLVAWLKSQDSLYKRDIEQANVTKEHYNEDSRFIVHLTQQQYEQFIPSARAMNECKPFGKIPNLRVYGEEFRKLLQESTRTQISLSLFNNYDFHYIIKTLSHDEMSLLLERALPQVIDSLLNLPGKNEETPFLLAAYYQPMQLDRLLQHVSTKTIEDGLHVRKGDKTINLLLYFAQTQKSDFLSNILRRLSAQTIASTLIFAVTTEHQSLFDLVVERRFSEAYSILMSEEVVKAVINLLEEKYRQREPITTFRNATWNSTEQSFQDYPLNITYRGQNRRLPPNNLTHLNRLVLSFFEARVVPGIGFCNSIKEIISDTLKQYPPPIFLAQLLARASLADSKQKLEGLKDFIQILKASDKKNAADTDSISRDVDLFINNYEEEDKLALSLKIGRFEFNLNGETNAKTMKEIVLLVQKEGLSSEIELEILLCYYIHHSEGRLLSPLYAMFYLRILRLPDTSELSIEKINRARESGQLLIKMFGVNSQCKEDAFSRFLEQLRNPRIRPHLRENRSDAPGHKYYHLKGVIEEWRPKPADAPPKPSHETHAKKQSMTLVGFGLRTRPFGFGNENPLVGVVMQADANLDNHPDAYDIAKVKIRAMLPKDRGTYQRKWRGPLCSVLEYETSCMFFASFKDFQDFISSREKTNEILGQPSKESLLAIVMGRFAAAEYEKACLYQSMIKKELGLDLPIIVYDAYGHHIITKFHELPDSYTNGSCLNLFHPDCRSRHITPFRVEITLANPLSGSESNISQAGPFVIAPQSQSTNQDPLSIRENSVTFFSQRKENPPKTTELQSFFVHNYPDFNSKTAHSLPQERFSIYPTDGNFRDTPKHIQSFLDSFPKELYIVLTNIFFEYCRSGNNEHFPVRYNPIILFHSPHKRVQTHYLSFDVPQKQLFISATWFVAMLIQLSMTDKSKLISMKNKYTNLALEIDFLISFCNTQVSVANFLNLNQFLGQHGLSLSPAVSPGDYSSPAAMTMR